MIDFQKTSEVFLGRGRAHVCIYREPLRQIFSIMGNEIDQKLILINNKQHVFNMHDYFIFIEQFKFKNSIFTF